MNCLSACCRALAAPQHHENVFLGQAIGGTAAVVLRSRICGWCYPGSLAQAVVIPLP